mgnify:CR=1 FL=1
MRLYELLKNYKWPEIRKILEDKYDVVNTTGYELTLELLKTLQPTNNTEIMTIDIKWEVFPSIDNYPEVVCSVVGKKHQDNDIYAIEFEEWTDWLGMNISEDTLLNMDRNEIIAHCVYEMTFLGFTPEEVRKESEKIKGSLDESLKYIEEHGAEGLTTLDDVMEELGIEKLDDEDLEEENEGF